MKFEEKLMKLNIFENKNNTIWEENYSYLKKIYDTCGHIKLDDENIKDEKITDLIISDLLFNHLPGIFLCLP